MKDASLRARLLAEHWDLTARCRMRGYENTFLTRLQEKRISLQKLNFWVKFMRLVVDLPPKRVSA